MPETKEASLDSSVEKSHLPSAKNELNKRQRKFAKRAIKALSKKYDVPKREFKVFRVTDENTEHEEPTDHVDESDGQPWVEATPSAVARYAIHYTGDLDLLEQDVMVRSNPSKGREGWATQIYPTDGQGNRVQVSPTVDIPLDI